MCPVFFFCILNKYIRISSISVLYFDLLICLILKFWRSGLAHAHKHPVTSHSIINFSFKSSLSFLLFIMLGAESCMCQACTLPLSFTLLQVQYFLIFRVTNNVAKAEPLQIFAMATTVRLLVCLGVFSYPNTCIFIASLLYLPGNLRKLGTL